MSTQSIDYEISHYTLESLGRLIPPDAKLIPVTDSDTIYTIASEYNDNVRGNFDIPAGDRVLIDDWMIGEFLNGKIPREVNGYVVVPVWVVADDEDKRPPNVPQLAKKYKHDLMVSIEKSEIEAGIKHGCAPEQVQRTAAIFEVVQMFRANPQKYGFTGQYNRDAARFDWGDFDVVVNAVTPREYCVDLHVSVCGGGAKYNI